MIKSSRYVWRIPNETKHQLELKHDDLENVRDIADFYMDSGSTCIDFTQKYVNWRPSDQKSVY